MKKSRLPCFLLIFSILIVVFLFKDSFNAYFFQDDWFTLRISRGNSIIDILNFFIPRRDLIYYRPIGMQMTFFTLTKLFGVNSLPFHILTFLTHILNIVLIFLLTGLLTKSKRIALLLSFLYSTSTIHYTPFFWSSTYPFELGPTFFFLSLYLILKYFRIGFKHYYLLSFVFYVLGLFTYEIAFVLPLILTLYILFYKGKRFFKLLIPYFAISLSIFFVRFFYFSPQTKGTYQLGIGKYTFSNLEAYLLWSFNLPEEIKAQLVRFWQINPEFIRTFTSFYYIFLIGFFINILLFIFIPLLTSSKTFKKRYIQKSIIFGLSWFIIGLLPILFFPKHSFPYYLPVSFVGLFLTLLTVFEEMIKKLTKTSNILVYILLTILVSNWLFLSFKTLQFNRLTHRIYSRSKISESLINKVKAQSEFPVDKTVYVLNTSENKLSLNDQDGLKVIFGNDKIKTYYVLQAPIGKYLVQ